MQSLQQALDGVAAFAAVVSALPEDCPVGSEAAGLLGDVTPAAVTGSLELRDALLAALALVTGRREGDDTVETTRAALWAVGCPLLLVAILRSQADAREGQGDGPAAGRARRARADGHRLPAGWGQR